MEDFFKFVLAERLYCWCGLIAILQMINIYLLIKAKNIIMKELKKPNTVFLRSFPNNSGKTEIIYKFSNQIEEQTPTDNQQNTKQELSPDEVSTKTGHYMPDESKTEVGTFPANIEEKNDGIFFNTPSRKEDGVFLIHEYSDGSVEFSLQYDRKDDLVANLDSIKKCFNACNSTIADDWNSVEVKTTGKATKINSTCWKLLDKGEIEYR